MILACPLCATRYLLPASLFANGRRQVRCARCSHTWYAEPPNEIDVVATPDAPLTPAVEQQPTPMPPGSNLPALVRKPLPVGLRAALIAGSAALIVQGIFWLIADRKNMIEQWPASEKMYDALGLRIYYTGEGLALKNVRSELVYDDGITKLVVSGMINNTTQKSQKVPDIMAAAIGSGGDVMQSWQIDAPTARLAAGDAVPFQSSINAPKGTVVNVNLNFIEPKNADE